MDMFTSRFDVETKELKEAYAEYVPRAPVSVKGNAELGHYQRMLLKHQSTIFGVPEPKEGDYEPATTEATTPTNHYDRIYAEYYYWELLGAASEDYFSVRAVDKQLESFEDTGAGLGLFMRHILAQVAWLEDGYKFLNSVGGVCDAHIKELEDKAKAASDEDVVENTRRPRRPSTESEHEFERPEHYTSDEGDGDGAFDIQYTVGLLQKAADAVLSYVRTERSGMIWKEPEHQGDAHVDNLSAARHAKQENDEMIEDFDDHVKLLLPDNDLGHLLKNSDEVSFFRKYMRSTDAVVKVTKYIAEHCPQITYLETAITKQPYVDRILPPDSPLLKKYSADFKKCIIDHARSDVRNKPRSTQRRQRSIDQFRDYSAVKEAIYLYEDMFESHSKLQRKFLVETNKAYAALKLVAGPRYGGGLYLNLSGRMARHWIVTKPWNCFCRFWRNLWGGQDAVKDKESTTTTPKDEHPDGNEKDDDTTESTTTTTTTSNSSSLSTDKSTTTTTETTTTTTESTRGRGDDSGGWFRNHRN